MYSCVTPGTLMQRMMQIKISVVMSKTAPCAHGQTAGRITIEMIQMDVGGDVE